MIYTIISATFALLKLGSRILSVVKGFLSEERKIEPCLYYFPLI